MLDELFSMKKSRSRSLYFRFKVISHMNIFFTCKNTLVILLQMYRLFILCLERRPQYRRHSRLFSLIPQVTKAQSYIPLHAFIPSQSAQPYSYNSRKIDSKSDLVIDRRVSLPKAEGSAEGDDNRTFGPYRRLSSVVVKTLGQLCMCMLRRNG